jgi:hypothetical protein
MKVRKGKTARKSATLNLQSALTEIETLNVDALRERWTMWLGGEPPPCQSGKVLRYLIAWRLQEARLGGLSLTVRQRLRALAKADGKKPITPLPALKRGMVLARPWKGKMREVQVLEKGFAYEGVVYRSLSETARAITGTRWSGPKFFGLRDGGGSSSKKGVDGVSA